MDDKSRKINQLSRLLFDKASDYFYGSTTVELLIGLVVAASSPFLTKVSHQYLLSLLALGGLITTYFFKKKADTLHGDAETMRRQSVLSQALGWKIDSVLYQLWKEKADSKTLSVLEKTPLPEDYYATSQNDNAKKLLEMTNESSFWSMQMNKRAKSLFLMLLAIFLLLLMVGFFTLPFLEKVSAQPLAYSLILIIPTLLSIDVFGLVFRLHTNENELRDIYSKTTEVLSKRGIKKDVPLAIRLAGEYNCLMANRVPMFRYFYQWWKADIQKQWDTRRN